MTVRPSTRFWVLRRDASRCRYCGTSAPLVEVVIDHVIPSALGGLDTSDNLDNLTIACVPCNAGKSDSLPDMRIAAEVRAVDSAERVWRSFPFEPRPRDWQHDVSLLIQAGVEPQALESLLNVHKDDWWRTNEELDLDRRWPAWNMAVANCIEFELVVMQRKYDVYEPGGACWPDHRDRLIQSLAAFVGAPMTAVC